MNINLPDIRCVVQFKISNYIMLPKLFQRLGRRDRDVFSLAVALIFIDLRQILSTNVHTLDGSAFKDFWLPVSRKNCNQITDVITRLYQENGQTRMARTGNGYQRTDPAML